MREHKNFIPSSAEKSLKPLELPDCIHLTEQYRCGIMKVNECIGFKCSSCQSTIQRRRSSDIWRRRMNSLSDEKQIKISSVYYGGKMPWKEAN